MKPSKQYPARIAILAPDALGIKRVVLAQLDPLSPSTIDANSSQLYLPFQRSYSEMAERDFIALPIATAADIRARADCQSGE
ncbi:hypothetical protein [Burkholderia thailandensis]|uniref:hypothetical protein n=1 Tax=Burkholderia thailandensis TaxID=57975 RepID=UPI0007685CD9|nr:hypothetical protein [Burkholderia thailandensis]KXF59781.1 hypothetical protein AQ476_18360 [Burkholderia thailandensis]PNE73170.1 hypothetical protein A8H37_13735 [Burkholderia thailandensis]